MLPNEAIDLVRKGSELWRDLERFYEANSGDISDTQLTTALGMERETRSVILDLLKVGNPHEMADNIVRVALSGAPNATSTLLFAAALRRVANGGNAGRYI